MQIPGKQNFPFFVLIYICNLSFLHFSTQKLACLLGHDVLIEGHEAAVHVVSAQAQHGEKFVSVLVLLQFVVILYGDLDYEKKDIHYFIKNILKNKKLSKTYFPVLTSSW